jgi:hypothetical protein
MANNATKIASIRALLESGAASISVDGVTTTLDREGLRLELRRLQDEDDTRQSDRPRAAGIYLGGF